MKNDEPSRDFAPVAPGELLRAWNRALGTADPSTAARLELSQSQSIEPNRQGREEKASAASKG